MNNTLLIILGLLGFTLFIGWVAYSPAEYALKQLFENWRHLAASTGLDFYLAPDNLSFPAKPTQVTGHYRGHKLQLRTVHQEGRLDTLIRVSAKPTTDAANADLLSEEAIASVKEDFRTLMSAQTPFKGHVDSTLRGDQLQYMQMNLEIDHDYLNLVFDCLIDLSELYPKVIAIGSEMIPPLETIIEKERSCYHTLATQLINNISQDTTARFSEKTGYYHCTQCLVTTAPHYVDLTENQWVTYYGCRACGQSRTLFEGLRLIAVLDNDPVRPAQEAKNGCLWVNWFTERTLFDFDEVQIIQATDEEVERFAVEVGNDTDVERKQISLLCQPTEFSRATTLRDAILLLYPTR
ncbi:MAG: hypothetical protein AAF485_29100 [Chloroflexota bacterium]